MRHSIEIEDSDKLIAPHDCSNPLDAPGTSWASLNETGAALDPGDPVPAGRCTQCEELVYVVDEAVKMTNDNKMEPCTRYPERCDNPAHLKAKPNQVSRWMFTPMISPVALIIGLAVAEFVYQLLKRIFG